MQHRRSEQRTRVILPAKVGSASKGPETRCVILDVSVSGCRIVCNRLNELPDVVWLRPQGFARPVTAHIVWRAHRFAGLHVDWEEQHSETAPGASETAVEAEEA